MYLAKPQLWGPRRAQGIVELALLLPVCLWLLLGIIDFGRAYYAYVAATNAAREGARYWASSSSVTSAQVKTRVQAEGSPNVVLDANLITLTSPTADQRKVQVQFQFAALTPFIATLWGGGNLTMTTAAVMPDLTPTGS